jgi:hypothetical protein
VGGRWCHVLECPGRDQLWLDVDRGCALLTRQTSYPSQALAQRVEFADFRELLPGLWAPFTLRNLHHERTPDGTLGKVVHDATLHVLRIRLNEEVEDGRFRFEPLPGAAGRIGDGPLRQTVSGGEEYLDEVVEWVHRYAPQFAPPAEAPARRAGWVNGADIALWALLAGVVVTALTWRCWVGRRGGGP